MDEKPGLAKSLKRLEVKGANLHVHKNLFNNCLETVELMLEMEEDIVDNKDYQEVKNNLNNCMDDYFSKVRGILAKKEVELLKEIGKYNKNS